MVERWRWLVPRWRPSAVAGRALVMTEGPAATHTVALSHRLVRERDLDELHAEIDADPTHSLMLWPGEGAQTVEQFVAALPSHSPWRAAALRVVIVRRGRCSAHYREYSLGSVRCSSAPTTRRACSTW